MVQAQARACRLCEGELALGPRPLFQVSAGARLLLIGQAPGRAAHRSGVPWDDQSGERLRSWLGISAGVFYDAGAVALLPMGLCYPGSGRSGDLPPMARCAPTWHPPLLGAMKRVGLRVLIGRYAFEAALGERYPGLTEAARAFGELLPGSMVLPHPSPRNNIWLKKNPWFEAEALPALRARVGEVLGMG